jgi:riboflavin kinase
MDILSLKKLALLGAHQKTLELSSVEFATHIDSSQQTAARKLKGLEDEKLISRKILPHGQLISITKYGFDLLQKEFNEYNKIFSGIESINNLSGKLITGLGEGQYYIALDGYRTQFIEKLGFDPYPGTLNVRLDSKSIDIRKKITQSIKISGFTDQNRTFGKCSCFMIMISGIEGAVITPERTHYPEDIIEIISPVNLRKHLDLKDGNIINVEVIK